MAWTDLSAAASGTQAPSARWGHGFTSAGGKLYVHGGMNDGEQQCLKARDAAGIWLVASDARLRLEINLQSQSQGAYQLG
jgi:hypothetical protein